MITAPNEAVAPPGGRARRRYGPIWHTIGMDFCQRPGVSVSEAVAAAGLDFDVSMQPLYYETPSGREMMTDRFALCRHANERYPEAMFGIVTDRYVPIQNRDLAAALNPLGELWPVETVADVEGESTLLIVLDGGTATVLGDELHSYCLITEAKAQSRALRMTYVPVRVSTQATLITGSKEAIVAANFYHMQGAAHELESRSDLPAQLALARSRTLAQLERLLQTAVTEAQIDAIIARAYLEPTKPSKVRAHEDLVRAGVTIDDTKLAGLQQRANQHTYLKSRVRAYRFGARERYRETCEAAPALAGSAYAVYVAVCEEEDYRRGVDNVVESCLFGVRSRTKARAFTACLALG